MLSHNYSNNPFEPMNMHKRDTQHDQKQLGPEMIRTLQYCQRKYHTILPNNPQRCDQSKSSHGPPLQHLFHSLIQQLDIFIQLIIQNMVLAKNETIRTKSLLMLQQLEQFSFISSSNQSQFRVSLPYFVSEQLEDYQLVQDEAPYYNAIPQQSMYQAPLLNFVKVFYELSQKAQNKKEEEKINLLSQFKPLMNASYFPIFHQSINKVRCKFNLIDEALLLQGLQRHTSKNLQRILDGYLWDKDLKQIKNKYKNSICNNAIQNKIKQWKLSQYTFMSRNELKSLIKGLKWFDKRWRLISRYFVPSRTAEFLESEVKQSDNLSKKRKKHALEEQYPEYYTQLRQFLIQDDINTQLKRIPQKFSVKIEQQNQVTNLMQKTFLNEEEQIDARQQYKENINNNNQSVDNYINFQFHGFENSNNSVNFNSNNYDFNLNIGFTNHLIEEHSKLENKIELKYEQKQDSKRDLNFFQSNSHFNESKNFDFRLEGSRSRLFCSKNDSQKVNSRLFTKIDQDVRSNRSLISVQPKGLERWKNIIEQISKK